MFGVTVKKALLMGALAFGVAALATAGAPSAAPAKTSPAAPAALPASATTNLPSMEVAQAVMVTVELDFGARVPGIAEALREVERRHQPADGRGRTFAILDAYGEPTPDGKLHLSMHVSSEKPGVGALVFKRTGQVLWQSRIAPSTNAPRSFTGKELMIYVDDGHGKLLTVDGSSNPASVLQAKVKELGLPMDLVWPEGAEREVTFMYSACGCPVKVLARRVGDRTIRTKDLPVIFPDDPAVVQLIARLMGWAG